MQQYHEIVRWEEETHSESSTLFLEKYICETIMNYSQDYYSAIKEKLKDNVYLFIGMVNFTDSSYYILLFAGHMSCVEDLRNHVLLFKITPRNKTDEILNKTYDSIRKRLSRDVNIDWRVFEIENEKNETLEISLTHARVFSSGLGKGRMQAFNEAKKWDTENSYVFKNTAFTSRNKKKALPTIELTRKAYTAIATNDLSVGSNKLYKVKSKSGAYHSVVFFI
jgi:hypothetical protein